MAMRGSDGDRERRSPYLIDDYHLDEFAERDFVVGPAETGRLGGGGLQRDGG